MRRTRTTTLALLALAASVAAACTGDDDRAATTTGSPAETTTTTPAVDCPVPVAAETGTLERTLTVDGTEREYLIAVPTGYDGTEAVPLVLTFHGLGSTDREQLLYSRWGQLGEEEGFLAVAPNAAGDSRQWDFLRPATDPSSDAAFIDALVEDLAATYCVDPARVFSSGISNGSAVTFGLACRSETPIAAFGGVAATFFADPYCVGAPPTSIVYFHGTADAIVPYGGGEVSVRPGTTVRSAPESMAAWAEHNGCDDPAVTPTASDVELTSWTDCDDGSAVDFYTVDGGGHSWPGSIPVERLGPTTDSIDATELMWAFFEAHPLVP